MTRLVNAPEQFAAEMLEGFLDANPDRVRAAPGGVVRSTRSVDDKVAVVIGGGSGHYPAFVGLVGHGLADGAVAGDVFASPSSQQIVRLARAAHHGGGVLFAFGNYAGDVLNFTMAAAQLRGLGMDVRIVAVTDDVASGALEQRDLRRGIAGDLVVFKLAGAAAEAGLDLDEVERIARKANDCTRSFGVAFAGCTLPGSTAPLFTVPSLSMGVGMGIHGEPGVATEAVPTADGVARLLVDRLLEERPAQSDRRVAAILNGLGGTKYEELFVLWHSVSQLLAEAGIEIVRPEVGEFVTSLDMAGCSLTLTWLDDELLNLWQAPADSPAYRRGSSVELVPATELPQLSAGRDVVIHTGDKGSRGCAHAVLAAFEAMLSTLRANEEFLGALDAVAGDGDHGLGMTRGCEAALAAVRQAVAQRAGAHTAVVAAAGAWSDRAGGTSGALWGEGLLAFGLELSDDKAPSAHDISRAATAALVRVQSVGRAAVGDKTLVDALHAFAVELASATDMGQPVAAAWTLSAAAATSAAESTADLTARLGRARPLAALGKGSPDPGAVSMALCLQSVARVLAKPLSSSRDKERTS
jgi:dihydroxyacetone kinase